MGGGGLIHFEHGMFLFVFYLYNMALLRNFQYNLHYSFYFLPPMGTLLTILSIVISSKCLMV